MKVHCRDPTSLFDPLISQVVSIELVLKAASKHCVLEALRPLLRCSLAHSLTTKCLVDIWCVYLPLYLRVLCVLLMRKKAKP